MRNKIFTIIKEVDVDIDEEDIANELYEWLCDNFRIEFEKRASIAEAVELEDALDKIEEILGR